MSQAVGHTIEDIYRGVINDVITQVREAFLDENVDIDVLQQLKNLWENQLRASNSIDFDGPKSLPPPPIRSFGSNYRDFPSSSGSSLIVNPNVGMNVLSNSKGIINKKMPPTNSTVRIMQLDGAGICDSLSEDYSLSSGSALIAKPNVEINGLSSSKVIPNKKITLKKSSVKIVQLDGGGPGMSDSSSEDEDDEEDPLQQFATLENDSLIDPDAAEEEPLNSGDDQSDEEDIETLFDAENVVVCQFEKVHRARSKWKFILKDGIMHINGRDYCFQKGSGEAEW